MPKDSDTHVKIVAQVESSAHEIYNCVMSNGLRVVGRIAGKLRFHKIQILPGDYVEISVSTADTSNGLITRRYSDNEGKRLFIFKKG